MKRRSFAEVAAAAVAAERAAMGTYVAEHIRQVDRLAARGRIAPEEAELLTARLKAFGSGIRAGLHIIDHVPTPIRRGS